MIRSARLGRHLRLNLTPHLQPSSFWEGSEQTLVAKPSFRRVQISPPTSSRWAGRESAAPGCATRLARVRSRHALSSAGLAGIVASPARRTHQLRTYRKRDWQTGRRARVGNGGRTKSIGVSHPLSSRDSRDGRDGNYRWGPVRKRAIIAWESSRFHAASLEMAKR